MEAVWTGKRMTGFIAQDVESAAEAIGYDFSAVDHTPSDEGKDNGYYGLRYSTFVVPLVRAVQELSDENETLKQANEELSSKYDELKARMKKLESLVESMAPSTMVQDQ